MTHDFKDFPCNNCGWCCKRTPCPLGLYLGEAPLSPCGHLQETAQNKFECGLILNEKEPLKLEALKNILLAGDGCSHIYGPSPISLMRELVSKGLKPGTEHWNMAKDNTSNEYNKMAQNSSEPDSILKALKEFNDYCLKIESSL